MDVDDVGVCASVLTLNLRSFVIVQMKDYPSDVCFDCGRKHGSRLPTAATVHDGVCEVCGKKRPVTEPRDFGYPHFPGHKES